VVVSVSDFSGRFAAERSTLTATSCVRRQDGDDRLEGRGEVYATSTLCRNGRLGCEADRSPGRRLAGWVTGWVGDRLGLMVLTGSEISQTLGWLAGRSR